MIGSRNPVQWGAAKILFTVLVVFLFSIAGIGIAGYEYYGYLKKQFKDYEYDKLSYIADLKVNQIVDWRNERKGNAQVVFASPFLRNAVQQFIKKPNMPGLRQDILKIMSSRQEAYQYTAVFLFDKNGSMLLSSAEQEPFGDHAKALALEAMRTKKAIFSDLHRGAKNDIHIDLLVPIIASDENNETAIAVFLLRIDPHQFLYPLIQSWPVKSLSSETLLVRSEGDDVLFLNELRHKKDTALSLRIPLSEAKLPAVIAMRGETSVTEGLDYRGTPVLFAARAISDSPWFLVAKMDLDEIEEPLRQSARFIAIIAALFIAVSGLGIAVFWYQHMNKTSKNQYEGELKHNQEVSALNKELESFSYSVSHDLRAPLRAIDGFSNILLDDYRDKVDDEGKRLLNVVRENTKKMGQLIEDMLQFSRMGRKEISMAEIDMEKLINDVYAEIKASVPERKMLLIVKPMASAYGDFSMISQVVSNLLSNAVKFTRQKDRAVIEIGMQQPGTGQEAIGDRENIYYVKDNGVGFDMKYADKLFGVFQRLHSMEEFEGTDIGLAIVKRIITRHGGHVWADAKVGEGTVFYFTLPKKP